MATVVRVDSNGMVGEGVEFERIRRITGYLTGDVKGRWNHAKQCELADRTVNSLTRASRK